MLLFRYERSSAVRRIRHTVAPDHAHLGISDLVAEFSAARPDAQIMLTQVSNPRAFGVAGLDSAGNVRRLEEKPEQPKRVSSTVVTGYWKDTGNVADMLEVNRLVLESLEPRLDGLVEPGCEIIGRAIVGAGTQVSASRIVGPAIIGARSKVAGSYVGPFTAIDEDCAVDDSEIEYVRRIEASLIGHDAEVMPASRVPRAHRLILGDHSRVQISS